jgi:hypothetical protein
MDESFESDKWKAIQGQFVDSFLKQRTALHSLIRSAVASDTIPTTDEGLCSRMAMSAAKHFDVDAGNVRWPRATWKSFLSATIDYSPGFAA